MKEKLIDLFRRRTNSVSFLAEVDGLRFFAISTVLIFHLNTVFSSSIEFEWRDFHSVASPVHMGWWLIRMDLGVKYFFAISGFILGIPFMKQSVYSGRKIDLKRYYYRRLLRLEPPYVLTLVIFGFVHLYVLKTLSIAEVVQAFLLSLFYVHSLVMAMPSPINPVVWSLEVEAHFYLVLPFVALLFSRIKSLRVVLSIMLLLFTFSVVARHTVLLNDFGYLKWSLLVFASNFITGSLFAWLFLEKPKWFLEKGMVWDFIGFLSFFGLFFFYKPQADIINNIVFNVSLFLSFIGVFKGVVLNYFFTRPFVYLVGGMCYSIYLLHLAFLHFLAPIMTWVAIETVPYFVNLLIEAIVFLPIVLLVSSVFFLAVEKPCMDPKWPTKLKALLLNLTMRIKRGLFR